MDAPSGDPSGSVPIDCDPPPGSIAPPPGPIATAECATLRRSLRAVAPRRTGCPTYDDVMQVFNSTTLSQFERHQLAGAEIQTACEMNGGIARRALVALYELQTPGERAEGVSSEHNGRGFDREYGRVASEIAERILGGARLSGRDMEKVLNIVQRFRVQLVVQSDRETLRWVFEDEHDEDDKDTHDKGGDAAAAPVVEDDEDDDFDEEDEEDDMDDFIVYSEDEDAEDGPISEIDDVPTTRKRVRLTSSSDDDGDEAHLAVAAPAPASAPMAAPVAAVVPARRPPTRENAHAELTVTEFGIRGAMLFSGVTEALFQRALAKGARSADQVYEFMRGVPGLRVSDVHVRLWQLRSSVAGPSSMKDLVVVVFIDGAFRHALVAEESGSMLRLKMLASPLGELVWVTMHGGCTLLYADP